MLKLHRFFLFLYLLMIRYQRIEDVEADGNIEDGVIDENSVLDIGKNKVIVVSG